MMGTGSKKGTKSLDLHTEVGYSMQIIERTLNPTKWYHTGAYAEYIAVSLSLCIHKPKELSWEVCAGISEVSTPAYK